MSAPRSNNESSLNTKQKSDGHFGSGCEQLVPLQIYISIFMEMYCEDVTCILSNVFHQAALCVNTKTTDHDK